MVGLKQKNSPRASRVNSSVRVLWLAACIMAFVTPRLSADITLVDRLSDARAYADAGVADAPPPRIQTDFLPANLFNSATSPAAKGGIGADADCTSNSEIVADNSMGTLRVTGAGGAHARVFVSHANAQASANLIVVSFTLTDLSCVYSLTGELSGCCSGGETAKLTAGSSTIFEVVGDPSHIVTLSETGTLPPGTYTLSVDLNTSIGFPASAEATGFYNSASANFNFALGPAPTPTPTPPVTVSLPTASADNSVPIATVIILPVTTTNIDSSLTYVGFQGDFTFDEEVVTFSDPFVEPAGLTANKWNVAANILPGPPGIRTLRVSAFVKDTITPLNGSGTLYNLRMLRVNSQPGASTPLTWTVDPDHFFFIDTNLNFVPTGQADGFITITGVGPTATPTPTPAPTPVTVSLPTASAGNSVPIETVIILPVTTTNIDSSLTYVGFQGDFTFDEEVVTFSDPFVEPAGLTANKWNVSANILPGPPGIRTLRVSAFVKDTLTPLNGSGTLYNLRMLRVNSQPGASTPLTWTVDPDHFFFIDTNLNFVPTGQADGFITVTGVGPTATPAPTPAPTSTPTPPPDCDPARFVVTAPITATAGVPFSFFVGAVCDNGHGAAKYFDAVHFTSSDGAAELPAQGYMSGGFGFFFATLHTVGSQTITARGGLYTFMTGTSNPIIIVEPTPTPAPTPTPTSTPGEVAQAVNLSTRLLVGTGNNAGIGGFIVTGSAPKQVLLRAIGPSLGGSGVFNPLANPTLELRDASGALVAFNDDWCTEPCNPQVKATGLAPTSELESAILATLDPGAYTAILRGKNNGSGVALIEVYDLSQAALSKLGNISTRAFVRTGSDIVIAGFILGDGSSNDLVVIRGLGPSLGASGLSPVLADPNLELRDSSGVLVASNNNWQDDPFGTVNALGLAPTNPLESAVAATLAPGAYTALVSGVNNGTGLGLVEVYDLGSP